MSPAISTDGKKRQAALAGRARRVGWPVEIGSNGKTWLYKITKPDGVNVYIHSSPSDVNWERTVLRRLNGKEGLFDAAEMEAREREAADKARRLAEDAKRGAVDMKRAEAEARQRELVNLAAGPFAPAVEFDPRWLLVPQEFPESRRGLLTPTAAKALLDTLGERDNRKFRPERRDEFVTIYRNNEWGVTHQGLAVDSNGKLQDGMHRCHACVELGVPLEIYATVGQPPEMWAKLDSPLPRTARDSAYRRGEKDVVALNAAARMVRAFDMYGSELHVRYNRTRFSIDTLDRTVEECGDPLRNAVAQARRIRTEVKRIVKAPLAATIYLVGRTVGHDDPRVTAFFDDIRYGEGLNRQDAAWHLRRYYITGEGSEGRADAVTSLALMIKAWNGRAVGRRMSSLSWRRNEWFPATIIDPGPAPLSVETIRAYNESNADSNA